MLQPRTICPLALRLLEVVAVGFLGGLCPLLAASNYATPYTFSTVVGTAGTASSNDGTGSAASFFQPSGITLDGSGNLYVADSYNDTIRKITPGLVVTTLAGSPRVYGTADGSGSTARFDNPIGVVVDGSGNIVVVDSYNHTLRKITPAGVVTTFVGSAGNSGSTDGSGSTARFYYPGWIALDKSGNFYVTDTYNSTIRKITPGGVVSTLAGSAGQTGSTDGSGSVARFAFPVGVAVDGSGNVYVADSSNDTIRKITSGGVVSTLAGSPGMGGSTDGSGSAARFSIPLGVTLDGSGNLYVADNGNDTIRKVTPGGVVTTLAGTPSITGGSTDGNGSAALFNSPAGLVVDHSGILYLTDGTNDTIRAGTAPDAFNGAVVNGTLKTSSWFGYYTYGSYPLVYEYYLGYEYVYPTNGGATLYDYTSGHFWYTQSSYYPTIYDYSLHAFLYYYSANSPHRHFYNYNTGTVITE